MSKNDSKTVRGAGKQFLSAFGTLVSVTADAGLKGTSKGLHFTADMLEGKKDVIKPIKTKANELIERGKQVMDDRKAVHDLTMVDTSILDAELPEAMGEVNKIMYDKVEEQVQKVPSLREIVDKARKNGKSDYDILTAMSHSQVKQEQ